MNTQFKKGALELCVLSQLVRGDKYGYELTERISGKMSIAGGTLYPILRKLKEDDYVTTYLVVRIGSGEKILQADGQGQGVPGIRKTGMEGIYRRG